MPIQWREQLSVGNDLIDTDHKHLIEIINTAESYLKTSNRSSLTKVLEELAYYGKLHFDREEKIAKSAGYPNAEHLHVSHGQLTEMLSEFQEDLSGTWPEDAETRFTAFLRDWLINHVIKEDLQMKPWLEKFSPSLTPR